jgi:hypothetical protein
MDMLDYRMAETQKQIFTCHTLNPNLAAIDVVSRSPDWGPPGQGVWVVEKKGKEIYRSSPAAGIGFFRIQVISLDLAMHACSLLLNREKYDIED